MHGVAYSGLVHQWLNAISDINAPHVYYDRQSRGKMADRHVVMLSNESMMYHKPEKKIGWIGDVLGLRQEGGWREVHPALKCIFQRFFEQRSEQPAWIILETWRVRINIRLPQMEQKVSDPQIHKHLSSHGFQRLKSFQLELPMRPEWFALRNERPRFDESIVFCEMKRRIPQAHGGVQRYEGMTWSRASYSEDWCDLKKGMIPAGMPLFVESEGVVRAPIINLEKLIEHNRVESFSIEVHPDDGNLVSFRHAYGQPLLYMTMQPEHMHLLKARKPGGLSWG